MRERGERVRRERRRGEMERVRWRLEGSLGTEAEAPAGPGPTSLRKRTTSAGSDDDDSGGGCGDVFDNVGAIEVDKLMRLSAGELFCMCIYLSIYMIFDCNRFKTLKVRRSRCCRCCCCCSHKSMIISGGRFLSCSPFSTIKEEENE